MSAGAGACGNLQAGETACANVLRGEVLQKAKELCLECVESKRDNGQRKGKSGARSHRAFKKKNWFLFKER